MDRDNELKFVRGFKKILGISLKSKDISEKEQEKIKNQIKQYDLEEGLLTDEIKMEFNGHCKDMSDPFMFLPCELTIGTTQVNHHKCFNCGERLTWKIEENLLEVVNPCEYPNGYPEYFVELDVPSGEIVIYNDFRSFYPKIEKLFDVCDIVGEIKYAKAYEKLGLAYIYVGNTCPSIYQVSDEHLRIGCYFNEEEEEKDEHYQEKKFGGKKVGGICTDLWAFCAVDRTDLEKRFGMTMKEFDEHENKRKVWTRADVIKVKPGKYKISGRHHIVRETEFELFSEITKIN